MPDNAGTTEAGTLVTLDQIHEDIMMCNNLLTALIAILLAFCAVMVIFRGFF